MTELFITLIVLYFAIYIGAVVMLVVYGSIELAIMEIKNAIRNMADRLRRQKRQ